MRLKKKAKALIIIAVACAGMAVYANRTETNLITYEKEVTAGDTVWSICSKIATDEDDLNKLVWQTIKDNHIENAADLQPGQKIIVNVQRARKS